METYRSLTGNPLKGIPKLKSLILVSRSTKRPVHSASSAEKKASLKKHPVINPCNIGALIIRIGFWAILYYNYNFTRNPPTLNPKAPTLKGTC